MSQSVPSWAKGLVDRNGITWKLSFNGKFCTPLMTPPNGSTKDLSPQEVMKQFGPVSFVRAK